MYTYIHRLDTLDKIKKQLVPTLDVDFLQGEDFKSEPPTYLPTYE